MGSTLRTKRFFMALDLTAKQYTKDEIKYFIRQASKAAATDVLFDVISRDTIAFSLDNVGLTGYLTEADLREIKKYCDSQRIRFWVNFNVLTGFDAIVKQKPDWLTLTPEGHINTSDETNYTKLYSIIKNFINCTVKHFQLGGNNIPLTKNSRAKAWEFVNIFTSSLDAREIVEMGVSANLFQEGAGSVIDRRFKIFYDIASDQIQRPNDIALTHSLVNVLSANQVSPKTSPEDLGPLNEQTKETFLNQSLTTWEGGESQLELSSPKYFGYLIGIKPDGFQGTNTEAITAFKRYAHAIMLRAISEFDKDAQVIKIVNTIKADQENLIGYLDDDSVNMIVTGTDTTDRPPEPPKPATETVSPPPAPPAKVVFPAPTEEKKEEEVESLESKEEESQTPPPAQPETQSPPAEEKQDEEVVSETEEYETPKQDPQVPPSPPEEKPDTVTPETNPNADVTPIDQGTVETVPEEVKPIDTPVVASVRAALTEYIEQMSPGVQQSTTNLTRNQYRLYRVFIVMLTTPENADFEKIVELLYSTVKANLNLCFSPSLRDRGIIDIPPQWMDESAIEVLFAMLDIFCRLANDESAAHMRGAYNFATLEKHYKNPIALGRFIGHMKTIFENFEGLSRQVSLDTAIPDVGL